MEYRDGIPGFAPVAGPRSRALVLGSYPSPKSFDEGFYYGHPQNRFWPLLAALAAAPGEEARAACNPPGSVAEKTALVLDSGLALWDVLESCRIAGAQDTSIRNPVPNDIPALVRGSGIRAVFCNGAAAHTLYQRWCAPATGLPGVRLPSTSPANAAFSLERLLEAWQPLRAYIRRD